MARLCDSKTKKGLTPLELEKGHKLAKGRSLSLIHMEMWLWLLVRDFELKKIERIKLLSPSKMAAICKEMQLPDVAEIFVDLQDLHSNDEIPGIINDINRYLKFSLKFVDSDVGDLKLVTI